MRTIRTLLFCLLGLGLMPAHADEAAVKRLTQLLGKVETLNGRFSQLTLDGSGTSLQENAGEMTLKRPGLFRWHTDAPMEQLLVSDGKQVWLYDPDLEQVTVRALDQRLTHTPALLLSGDVSQISNSFDISYKESSGVVDFELKPKARDTLFDSLRMSFRQGVINDMQLIDSAGQRTNILFSGLKVNTPVEQSQFTFKVPEGADVIQE
ncbi:outer membrane lipoprotein chaperone LolA [Pseudomonas matsuisoli]|uniref:Outer-membrane lipoprotein carrier protein n=1 Tax=Pseudomonas matsuisoli TaxID=1515666 RepID=A0A917PM08_9PSED|nr:outer membrane lipoprotein chaperone LolA [Pseudomonas matsuisoli]GGJ84442.1 outer-membrane lipoprotein carrier protein [Pseudomonas matsuisoli]